MSQMMAAAMVLLVGVFGCLLYMSLSSLALDWLLPGRGGRAGRNLRLAGRIRPWLFLLPALLLMAVYLGYPMVQTLLLSLRDVRGAWVGGRIINGLPGMTRFGKVLQTPFWGWELCLRPRPCWGWLRRV